MMSNFGGHKILHLSQQPIPSQNPRMEILLLPVSSTTTNYLDDEYLNEVVSCYKISYTDACNNKSPVSVEACPIKLIATLQPDNAVNLSWSAYDRMEKRSESLCRGEIQ